MTIHQDVDEWFGCGRRPAGLVVGERAAHDRHERAVTALVGRARELVVVGTVAVFGSAGSVGHGEFVGLRCADVALVERLDPAALQFEGENTLVEVGVAALRQLLHEPLDRHVLHATHLREGVSQSCARN